MPSKHGRLLREDCYLKATLPTVQLHSGGVCGRFQISATMMHLFLSLSPPTVHFSWRDLCYTVSSVGSISTSSVLLKLRCLFFIVIIRHHDIMTPGLSYFPRFIVLRIKNLVNFCGCRVLLSWQAYHTCYLSKLVYFSFVHRSGALQNSHQDVQNSICGPLLPQ